MPASSSLTIHLLELKLISDYFRNAGDSFVDHSANYYTTVDTPVRRELLRAAHANYARGSRDRPEPITGKDGRIDSNSSQLLWYLLIRQGEV